MSSCLFDRAGQYVGRSLVEERRQEPFLGINVNYVAPGQMYTEMIAPFVDADPDKFNRRVPLGRIGKTEEIAAVVVFLCSDRASYMTGATVDVSGGLAMH